MKKYTLGLLLTTILIVPTFGQQAQKTEEQNAAYIQVITQRAEKILKPMEIIDGNKATSVKDIIIQQYLTLSEIHDLRDARIDEIKKQLGKSEAADKRIGIVKDASEAQLYRAGTRFVARLLVELSPEQVDEVKDGLTYGVLPITYKGYLDMLPNLTKEQQDQIMAYLVTARDFAMTGGSSEEKHAWFGKYKGKINNYLSDAGYDLRKAGEDWKARLNAASSN